MIDLDHFKVINDTRGHLTGDRVLTNVARCIRHELRGYDAVGRFGGEEFAVLLPNVDVPTTHAVAERLLASVRRLVTDDEVRITASLGLVHCPANDVDLATLLHRADTALFRAKARGRDQVSDFDRLDLPRGSHGAASA
jgi:diguanylate cyclase (GGDEF)-like protein